MSKLFLIAAFASVASAALPWNITVEDTACLAVAETEDVNVALVGCAGGVHAVDVVQMKVVQTTAVTEVAAIAALNTYTYLLQTDTLTVVRTADITSAVATLNLATFAAGRVTSVSTDVRGFLYVSTMKAGVVVINVTDPTHPARVFQDTTSQLEMTSGTYQSSTQLFFGGVMGGVVVYNMSTPAEPVLLANKTVLGGNAQVAVTGATLVVCMVGTRTPVYVLDITDPADPTFGANFYSNCDKVVSDGQGKVCTMSQEYAEVFAVTGTTLKQREIFTGSLGARSVALSKDSSTLYMGTVSMGLGLYNVTNTDN